MTTPLKVLIAEDEKLLRRAYSDGLSNAGFTVTLAEDGEQALAQMRKHAPDVLLLDLLMPKMSGYEALKIIKADPELNKVAVIVLSNLGRPTDPDELDIVGDTPFIVKSDCSLKDLAEQIRRIASKA